MLIRGVSKIGLDGISHGHKNNAYWQLFKNDYPQILEEMLRTSAGQSQDYQCWHRLLRNSRVLTVTNCNDDNEPTSVPIDNHSKMTNDQNADTLVGIPTEVPGFKMTNDRISKMTNDKN